MNILCQIAARYGTDKHNDVYFPEEGDLTSFYDSLFNNRRESVKKVLEIGIGTAETMRTTTTGIYGERIYKPGASLYMWAEYFPKAEIYALEIDESVLVNTDRIHSYRCDQGNLLELETIKSQLGNGLDLIIDDGSHIAEHQILTAQALRSLLAPNGFYIIEDVVATSTTFVSVNLPDFSRREFLGKNGLVGNCVFWFTEPS